MYIEKTTSAERRIICDVLGPAVGDLKCASDMLSETLVEDADDIQDWMKYRLKYRLRLISTALEEFVATFYVTCGDDQELEAKNRFTWMERARLAKEVETEKRKIAEIIPAKEYRSYSDKLDALSELPDEKALPELRALYAKLHSSVE